MRALGPLARSRHRRGDRIPRRITCERGPRPPNPRILDRDGAQRRRPTRIVRDRGRRRHVPQVADDGRRYRGRRGCVRRHLRQPRGGDERRRSHRGVRRCRQRNDLAQVAGRSAGGAWSPLDPRSTGTSRTSAIARSFDGRLDVVRNERRAHHLPPGRKRHPEEPGRRWSRFDGSLPEPRRRNERRRPHRGVRHRARRHARAQVATSSPGGTWIDVDGYRRSSGRASRWRGATTGGWNVFGTNASRTHVPPIATERGWRLDHVVAVRRQLRRASAAETNADGRIEVFASRPDATLASHKWQRSQAARGHRGRRSRDTCARSEFEADGEYPRMRMDEAELAKPDLEKIATWLRNARSASPRPDGRRHLDRVGDSRLPRAATGSGRRIPPPRRPRRLQYYMADPDVRRHALAEPHQQRDVRRAEPNAAHRALVDLERKRRAPRARHAERRRPAPRGRTVARDRRRDPRQRARGEVHDVRVARSDARDARPGPGRRGRSGVPRVRRHLEVGDDQLRREPRRRPTSSGRSSRRAAPTCSSRSARRSPCIPPPRCPRSRSGTALDS